MDLTKRPTPRQDAQLLFFSSLRILLTGIALCSFASGYAEPVAPAAAPPPAVSFGMAQTRLWLSSTQVVAFTLPSAAKEKIVFPTQIEPASAGEILQQATVLKGQKIGFLRLRSLQAGKATVKVGDKSLPVEIVQSSAGDVLSPKPEIVSPVSGACIYGKITVGVELDLPDIRSEPSEPKIVLPEGTELTPRAQTLDPSGSARLFVYDIDADKLPPGPLELQAYFKDTKGRRVMAESVKVDVIRPDPSLMMAGACADRVNDPRPQRFGEKIPAIKQVKDAQGEHSFVTNANADPAWCLKETIDQPGLYQLIMRVRGDAAQGAYPSIGLILNEDDRFTVSARLVDKDWHRIPIGKPVQLASGEQFLTARFVNDFNQGKTVDRNLYLDGYELVRVSAQRVEPTAGADGDAMMMSNGIGGGDPAMMMSSGKGSGGDAAMMSMMMSDAASADGDGNLRASFNRALEGRLVQGPLTISGTTWRTEKTPAPDVDLLINGKVFATQQGRDLSFRVPAEALRAGSNALQLRARSLSGGAASSPVESVIKEEKEQAARPIQRHLRYTVEDRAWDPGMAQRMEKDNPPKATFFSNGEATLNLPDDLEGKFSVQIDAKGQDFQGPPIVEAFLKTGDAAPEKIGEVPLVSYYRGLGLGTATLKAGPKQLILRYSNDLAVQGEGDRNWWLRSLSLSENIPRSTQPPTLKIVYPKLLTAPLDVYGATAIVAKVFAPDGIESCDVTIDGVRQNLGLTSDDGLGRVVIPIITTSMAPGDHALRVVVRSKNGQETTSDSLMFRVADQAARADSAYARAVFLLNRFGFGPEPEELADILLMGEKNWLKDRLSRSLNEPGEQAALQRSWNEYPDVLNKGQVVTRALSYFLRSPNPVRCRFVLWTENHFSTWLEKVEAYNKWPEHERFLQIGVAPFGDLLMASATSPAMLVYLDQARSFSKKLNENYAREIMELHTVGVHGGYRQEDVTNLASILTGWTVSLDAPIKTGGRDLARNFRYDPGLGSAEGRQVFGMDFPKTDDPRGRYDRTLSAIEMLAGHPSTALYISRKLAEQYVAVPAPDSLVNRLATRFRETGGAINEVLLTLADSPEFWATLGQPKIATPLDYSLRLSRMSGATNAGAVNDFLKKSGTGLFDRATPDGYPEDDGSYASSNALLQRWRFTQSLAGNLRKLLPNSLLPSGDTPLSAASQDRVVDFYAARLFGQPLPASSRQAASQYLSASTDPDRIKLITSFVSQLPPASLR